MAINTTSSLFQQIPDISVHSTKYERASGKTTHIIHTYNMGSTLCFEIWPMKWEIYKGGDRAYDLSHVNYVFIASEFLRGQMPKNAISGQIPGT